MWSLIVVPLVLQAAPLELSKLGDGAALPELIWKQAPDLHDARARLAQAEAERRKALRLPNPGLDVALNTLPIGPSNPVDLKDPWLNTPNLGVGLSMLLELGKREPRQEATAEAARVAALDALEQVRTRVFDLEDVIGDVAAAQVRVEVLEGLSVDARRLAELQAARSAKGDTSDLDADRAQLEAEGVTTALADARADLSARLRECAERIAAPCAPFGDSAQAVAWLDLRLDATQVPLEDRPDLRALEAAIRSARASQRLAERQWLPDPTVRVGYVRDQFVVSGNQQNSLFVGFSMPLPFFEHGVDDAEAAGVIARSAETERSRRLDAAREQLSRLEKEALLVEARQKRIAEHSLPLARSIVARLEAAVSRGAAPLQELLLSRRTLVELLLSGSELNRSVFHLRVARARLTRSLPALPEASP